MSDNIVRVGVAVAVWSQGKILLGLRQGSHGAGTWAFPGGHIDFGENPKQTALRELKEELGDHCEFSKIEKLYYHPYENTMFSEGKQYITLFFTTNLLSGEPKLMEPNKCEKWEWFDPENLPTPLFGALSRLKLRP